MNTVPIIADDQVRHLAENIAMLIAGEKESGVLERLQTSIDEIRTRLDSLESAIPKMKKTAPAHPSQDRFEIDEAGVDGNPGEKACPYEPSAKPCDHCSMCSSRGF